MTLVNLIDMHMHTTASDGASSPAELVRKAKEIGLKLISITDHDTVDGLAEAREEAEKSGIHFINGVELSVIYHTPLYADGKKGVEMHLLGYGFDPDNAELRRVLEENKQYRVWRARQIVGKVNAVLAAEGHALISDTYLDEKLRTVEGAFGRPHLAEILIELGIVSSTEQAFQKYLIGCDVPKREISFGEGSRLIKAAGGKAGLAHPMTNQIFGLKKISPSLNVHRKLLEEMLPCIDALECFYWDHSIEIAEFYASFARRHNLIITGGTDHHGSKKITANQLPESTTFRERLGQYHVPNHVAQYFGINL